MRSHWTRFLYQELAVKSTKLLPASLSGMNRGLDGYLEFAKTQATHHSPLTPKHEFHSRGTSLGNVAAWQVEPDRRGARLARLAGFAGLDAAFRGGAQSGRRQHRRVVRSAVAAWGRDLR